MGAGTSIIEMFPLTKEEIIITLSDTYSTFEEHDFDIYEYPYIVEMLKNRSKTQTFELDKRSMLDDIGMFANYLLDAPKNYSEIISDYLKKDHPDFVLRKALAHMFAASLYIQDISNEPIQAVEFTQFNNPDDFDERLLEAKIVIGNLDRFENEKKLPFSNYIQTLNTILENELYLLTGSDAREFYLRKAERLKEKGICTLFDKELESESYHEFKNGEIIRNGNDFLKRYASEDSWNIKSENEDVVPRLKELLFSHYENMGCNLDRLDDEEVFEYYSNSAKAFLFLSGFEKRSSIDSYVKSAEKALDAITEGIRFNPLRMEFYDIFIKYNKLGLPIPYEVLHEVVDSYEEEFSNYGYMITDNRSADELKDIDEGIRLLKEA
ncbi:hypothetical protein C0585_06620 [Candidatus Woesearchaeota archaeon]|nr:MAG: hypothetical protein C0585_06620 [Candidatus Woesearchaeota archaeon]